MKKAENLLQNSELCGKIYTDKYCCVRIIMYYISNVVNPMTNDSFNPVIIVICVIALIGFVSIIAKRK